MSMKCLSRKEDFQMLPRELHHKRYKATSEPQDRLSKRHKQDKVQNPICRSSKDNKTTRTSTNMTVLPENIITVMLAKSV
ncbi:hypothetical protein TNCV_1309471 [Trichonephila clavipes]|nr:hypothetical protein TNCV_1309471 [Trichonephila clavipes]